MTKHTASFTNNFVNKPLKFPKVHRRQPPQRAVRIMLKASNSVAGIQRQAFRRGLATVADPPVRRYGGLKDQDRIFTNAYCRHDHGLKGALVSRMCSRNYYMFIHIRATGSLVVTGIARKTFFRRATLGSFKQSRILGLEVVVVPDSQVVSNGRL